MTTRARLHLHVFAPALTSDDGRPLAAVEGMERALPGLRLAWRLSEAGRPIALAQRGAWLAESAADGEFGLLCNGDESYPVTMDGRRESARASPGGEPLLIVHAKLPQDEAVVAAAADMLEHVAEGVRARWGVVAPGPVRQVIAAQTGPKTGGPERPPHGLPALKLPWNIRSPKVPRYLGWINYWSAASAEAIGFPDASRDAELLTRARRTASGGWVVRLTDAPLDLDNPAHLEALKWAYERFPEIGGRAET
ncbi:hypothetical protein JRI60_34250 [Archangium violaceum]|uniref:DUF5953 family protein n=1 Tax=Archangium violaceum TaxID=83451 RepID=UPI0019509005|nr:DUF5953 family protein [Archangium violaceum]QRN94182.1 hypothetical protein JRI60_34250 [Archangium violaceum]